MMETAWYFRLFFVNISWFVISGLLFGVIRAKRMRGPGPNKAWMMAFWITFIVGWILTWFVPFSINMAFWIGVAIIFSGETVYALGYIAMRDHHEKNKAVVEWGIYKVSRNSHVLAGIICLLGTIVIGWNPSSLIYAVLWGYFVLYTIMSHFGVLNEEKLNIERFGQEYADYMDKTPRYIGLTKSVVK